MRQQRVALVSPAPLVGLGVIRLVLAASAIGFGLAGGSFADDDLVIVGAAIALPWGVATLVLALTRPRLAANPLWAIGDILLLTIAEAVSPPDYGAVRFVAILLICGHAIVQGERRGVAIAAGFIVALVSVAAISSDPISGWRLAFYELLFALVALAGAAVVGRALSSESAGRLRARKLTRDVAEGEKIGRRRIAQALHDGPVQELAALELVLHASRDAVARGDAERAADLLTEAEDLAGSNLQALRDEIVELSPTTFREPTFAAAVEDRVPFWHRRFDFDVHLALEPLPLRPEVASDLFQIASEAVANAGRHANASKVDITLSESDGAVELVVEDDGDGFPFALVERNGAPGHIGLDGMRERAELLEAELEIATGSDGTRVCVRVPA